jgi:hypothetical protein
MNLLILTWMYHCYLNHPKIPRHTRIPTAMATINPKTPAIMSQSELRILPSIHSSIKGSFPPVSGANNKVEEIALSSYAQ